MLEKLGFECLKPGLWEFVDLGVWGGGSVG